MSDENYPEFRLGTELATSLTATLTERLGEPVERIPTPARLADWLAIEGFDVGACDAIGLELAKKLREAIHSTATAVALHEPLPVADLQTINEVSERGLASAVLTSGGDRIWKLNSVSKLEDALGVIAADAIAIISGVRAGKLALCASETCRAAFFDTSRSRSRKWCDMNTCGNREKKARFYANRNESSPQTN